jgi:ribosomal protein S18 acetylase RimI-like enzyme
MLYIATDHRYTGPMTAAFVRPATRDDARAIAELFLISSDGLAAYIWGKMDMPGLSLIEIGTRRYAREGVAFSYQNCLMLEHQGRVAGMLHGYAMDRDPAAAPDSDPVLRPYSELEDDGSFYVSGLAIDEDHRGRGYGAQLMAAGAAHARAMGRDRLSLICFERNTGAMRFYRRLGFRELDRRAIVPHPTLHYSDGDAILLARTYA